MKLTPPTNVAFGFAVLLVALGLLANQGVLAALSAYAFWLVVAGFVLLMLANLLKDL